VGSAESGRMDRPGPASHLAAVGLIARLPRQQPDGGDTPGVAAAPVALAGVIVLGFARFIVMLSAHAEVFGVGITPVDGSMLVSPSTATVG
jgi:hypothetical protein